MPHRTLGVLLAGGQARRMGGGDKCLRPLGGKPILTHVIERARPQVAGLVLNANGDPDRFRDFGLPVVPDVVPDYAGPLAGILTGMEWARRHAPDCDLVATFPTDSPFFPTDLVFRLEASFPAQGADIACAASNGRTHPPFALWPVSFAEDLRQAMLVEGIRKIDEWTARYRVATVSWKPEPFDPFFNTNRPEDLEEAERLLASQSAG